MRPGRAARERPWCVRAAAGRFGSWSSLQRVRATAWVWRTCGSEADAEGEPRHVEAERRGDVVLVVLAGQIAERQRDREAAQPGGHHCARQDSPGIPLDPGPTFLG